MIDFRRSQFGAKILCMCQHYLLFSGRSDITWMDDTCTPHTTRTNHEPRWRIYTTLGPCPKHGWQTATPCQLEYPPMIPETEKPASAASAAKPAKTCFCSACRFFAALALQALQKTRFLQVFAALAGFLQRWRCKRCKNQVFAGFCRFCRFFAGFLQVFCRLRCKN